MGASAVDETFDADGVVSRLSDGKDVLEGFIFKKLINEG
jgi:hypothetical protein